jgi:hypothetical protein
MADQNALLMVVINQDSIQVIEEKMVVLCIGHDVQDIMHYAMEWKVDIESLKKTFVRTLMVD